MTLEGQWSRPLGAARRSEREDLCSGESAVLTATMADRRQSLPEPTTTTRRLLVLCLAARWQPVALSEARALAGGGAVDWTEFAWMSDREGVAPLLYEAVVGQGLLPPEVEHVLRRHWRAWGLWNAAMMVQLECILRQFNAAGIPVILLKGAALLETVYRQPAVRPMCDVDLLLRHEDVARAANLLAALGFAPPRQSPRKGAALDYDLEIMFRRPGRPDSFVEIHRGLFYSPHYQPQIATEWFWQTARPCQVGQAEARVLSPEALLLHLCGHLWLHHREQARLLWEHDIVEVIRSCGRTLDWDVVLDRAGRCDLVLPLQELLPAVARDWDAPVPADVIADIYALVPAASERRALARFVVAQRSYAGTFWIDLAAAGGWGTRLGRAWSNLFPSAAYMRERYAIRRPLLVPFYYPYRWFLALRSVPALCRALAPGSQAVRSGRGRS